MIGGKGKNPDLFTNLKQQSDKISNIHIKGFMSNNEIVNYYKKAIMLINTSKVEGFPNVFLEAWINSIPIISLNVDPDGIISKHNLGYISKNFDKMIFDIKNLLENKKLREEMGKNGRKYIEDNHDMKKIVDRYENVIKELIQN